MDKKKNVYRPKPGIRKALMYLNNKRVCCDCGNNRTNDKIVNRVQWYRDTDDQGKWTGKYMCNKCYHRKYREKREKEIILMRQKFVKERNSRFEKLNTLKTGIEGNKEIFTV